MYVLILNYKTKAVLQITQAERRHRFIAPLTHHLKAGRRGVVNITLWRGVVNITLWRGVVNITLWRGVVNITLWREVVNITLWRGVVNITPRTIL